MKQKVLDKIPGLGEADKITIKRYDYGEQSAMLDYTTDIDVAKGKEAEAKLNFGKMRIMTLVYGIASVETNVEPLAQFKQFAGKENTADIIDKKINIIKSLDPTTGSFLFEEINALNGALGAEQKKE